MVAHDVEGYGPDPGLNDDEPEWWEGPPREHGGTRARRAEPPGPGQVPLTIRLRRYNPEVRPDPWWADYTVSVEPSDRLLDALHEVKWHHDGTLALRRSCAHGICGSDAMLIDGRNQLACKVLVKDVAPRVTVEPIRGLPVLKDLIVDMEPFFEGYRKVLPYLINDDEPPDRERLQSQADRERFDDTTKCILCAACTTSCPIFWGDGDYVGPAAIVNAHRFIFDSRDQAARERLNILSEREGVFRCRTTFNCTEACPRGIKVTKAIQEVKRAVMFDGGEPVHRITLIPGDGIGPEVTDAARQAVAATGVAIDWDVQPAGASVMRDEGTPLPERVLTSIRENRVALKGPLTTPVGTGFRSVNVALRHDLDLFAAVRPVASLPGITSRFTGVDLVVIRENTEDLYAGIEFEKGSREMALLCRELSRLRGTELPSDAGVTVKPISVSGTRRTVRFAFDFARHHGRRNITVGHKANIMPYSDGLFLHTARAIAASAPDVTFEAVEIDELALRLVTEPEAFDVLLLPNLYGDILSDLCAGLVGGLGVASGANLGWEYAVFEPVHGSAPDIAGHGVANPVATILSAATMLAHISEHHAAAAVREGVRTVLAGGRIGTPDLGGRATTRELAAAIAEATAAAAVLR